MYSKFPFSMENLPRQRSFVCLSLKFGCIISALIIILYSVLSLAQCTATIGELAPKIRTDDMESIASFSLIVVVTFVHVITFSLTALMLVGTLREKASLMRPWVVWTSIQVMFCVMMFIFWTAMSINHIADNSLMLYALEFLSLLLRFYMLVLVASYYKQLEEEMYDGERLKTLVGSDSWYNTA